MSLIPQWQTTNVNLNINRRWSDHRRGLDARSLLSRPSKSLACLGEWNALVLVYLLPVDGPALGGTEQRGEHDNGCSRKGREPASPLPFLTRDVFMRCDRFVGSCVLELTAITFSPAVELRE